MGKKIVELYLDGKEVDLNPFADRIISGALLPVGKETLLERRIGQLKPLCIIS